MPVTSYKLIHFLKLINVFVQLIYISLLVELITAIVLSIYSSCLLMKAINYLSSR